MVPVSRRQPALRRAGAALLLLALAGSRPLVGQPVGGEFHVNFFTLSFQQGPAPAVAADGSFVIVWESFLEDGDEYGVFGRRFTSSGAPIGINFRANTTVVGRQSNPAMGMSPGGAFVVVWQAVSSSDYEIYGQRFDPAGLPSGGEFRVNTYTTSSQRLPRVAMDGAGNFLAAWTDFVSHDVLVQGFSAAGSPRGGAFRANAVTNGNRTLGAVAADATGAFVVVWDDLRGSPYAIYGRRFASDGSPRGPEFRVNTSTKDARSPSVAFDAAGGFFVTWRNDGYTIHGRRFTPGGAADGSEVEIAAASITTAFISASVAAGPAGAFLVAWEESPTPQASEVFGRYIAPSGQPFGASFRVNTYASGRQTSAHAAGNQVGNFVVAWTSYGQTAPADLDIFGQRFGVPYMPLTPELRINTLTTQTQRFPSVAEHASGAFVVVWSSYADGPTKSDVVGQRFAAGGAPLGGEFHISTATTGYHPSSRVAATPDGGFVVVWSDTAADGDSNGIFARRFLPSGAAAGPEFRVNAVTTSSQSAPSIAVDPSGGFVIAYSSADQDGSLLNIYAQRFFPSGQPVGTSFRVNTTTAGLQLGARVAASAGGFVVAWLGPDGSSYGVFAQRFSSSGAASGSEFRVNVSTIDNQQYAVVGFDPSGGFLVVWTSAAADGLDKGILARRFSSSGAPLASEFLVNTTLVGDQVQPSVAFDTAGGALIAWYGPGDGSGSAVFARRFRSTGEPVGLDFVVNALTSGEQRYPSVANGKNPIVVWTGANDGSMVGISGVLYPAVCRSADEDGNGTVNVSDVLYLINHLFAGGPAPKCGGDADGNQSVNVSDVLYLINYLFAGGPAPA